MIVLTVIPKAFGPRKVSTKYIVPYSRRDRMLTLCSASLKLVAAGDAIEEVAELPLSITSIVAVENNPSPSLWGRGDGEPTPAWIPLSNTESCSAELIGHPIVRTRDFTVIGFCVLPNEGTLSLSAL